MILMFVHMGMEHVYQVTLVHVIVGILALRVKYRSVTLCLLITQMFAQEMVHVQDTINARVVVDTMARNAQIMIVLRSQQHPQMHVQVTVVV